MGLECILWPARLRRVGAVFRSRGNSRGKGLEAKHWFSTFGGVEVGMGWVRRRSKAGEFWRQKQGQVMMGSQPFGGLWGHEEEEV